MTYSTTVDGDAVAAALGASLRRLRKAHDFTLQQLADVCGLSQPFLSQLENGKAMPSLLTLHHVAAALDTTAQTLLDPHPEAVVSLVRAGQERCFELREGVTVRFLVEGDSHHLEPNEVTLEAGVETGHDHVAHHGEELVYVLAGRLEVDLEGREATVLGPGDAYAFPATAAHCWRAVGDAQVRFLIVTSPPSF